MALAACGTLRAEIARTIPAATPAAHPERSSSIPLNVVLRLDELCWLAQSTPGATGAPVDQGLSAGAELESQIRCDLPPGPSSMALGLGALGCLGAYQLGRSVKKIQLGVLPGWYHTDAIQVGHVTPFDLDFGALPICVFEVPVIRPAFADRIPRELRSRLRSQFFLLLESPRGPPDVS